MDPIPLRESQGGDGRVVKASGQGSGGSVLMEYVLVCGCIMVLIQWLWKEGIYDFGTGWTGTIGGVVLAYYQRVLCGIALPVP